VKQTVINMIYPAGSSKSADHILHCETPVLPNGGDATGAIKNLRD
jgi:hypothetical protein